MAGYSAPGGGSTEVTTPTDVSASRELNTVYQNQKDVVVQETGTWQVPDESNNASVDVFVGSTRDWTFDSGFGFDVNPGVFDGWRDSYSALVGPGQTFEFRDNSQNAATSFRWTQREIA